MIFVAFSLHSLIRELFNRWPRQGEPLSWGLELLQKKVASNGHALSLLHLLSLSATVIFIYSVYASHQKTIALQWVPSDNEDNDPEKKTRIIQYFFQSLNMDIRTKANMIEATYELASNNDSCWSRLHYLLEISSVRPSEEALRLVGEQVREPCQWWFSRWDLCAYRETLYADQMRRPWSGSSSSGSSSSRPIPPAISPISPAAQQRADTTLVPSTMTAVTKRGRKIFEEFRKVRDQRTVSCSIPLPFVGARSTKMNPKIPTIILCLNACVCRLTTNFQNLSLNCSKLHFRKSLRLT